MKPLAHRFAPALVLATLALPALASADPGSPGSTQVAARGSRIESAGEGAVMRSGGLSGAFQPIAPGAALPSRTEIRTGAGSLRLVLADGARVEIAPGSRVSVLGRTDAVVERGVRSNLARFEVLEGEIAAETPSSSPGPTILFTSREVLAAPLPGSRVRVRAATTAGSATSGGLGIAVDAGEARFAARGTWKPLTAGKAVEVLADHPTPAPAALPAAPAWAPTSGACSRSPAPSASAGGNCPLAVVTSAGGAAPLAIGWREAAGARGYLVEIARDALFGELVARHQTSALAIATGPLPAGRYFARVATIGAEGMAGTPGAVREMRVVRLTLPEGTSARDGRWALPQGRAIRIADPAGLELSVGRSGFSRAPEQFAAPAEPTVAQIRVAGAPEAVEIALSPSPLHATIAMSPTRATWPDDPVDVLVRIDDGGAPVPASFAPKLIVRIGPTEVPVEWWRRDNLWRARIEPRVPPGPWVVRVEARDPHDNEIGRGFLEVSGPPLPVAWR